jgi:hypothetical protein
MGLLTLSHRDLYLETKSINPQKKGQPRERKLRRHSDLKSDQRDAAPATTSCRFSPFRSSPDTTASCGDSSLSMLCVCALARANTGQSSGVGSKWLREREEKMIRESEDSMELGSEARPSCLLACTVLTSMEESQQQFTWLPSSRGSRRESNRAHWPSQACRTWAIFPWLPSSAVHDN